LSVAPTNPPPKSIESPLLLPVYAKFIANYNPQVHTEGFIKRVAHALCVSDADLASGGSRLRDLIRVYEETEPLSEDEPNPKRDGQLDDQEMRSILSPRIGPQVWTRRPLVEQIPLAVSFAPHLRLPRGGTIPAGIRLEADR
jgi:hypothetical protein